MATAAQTQVGVWLGIPAPASESDILHLIEDRLAPSVIARLATLGFERAEIDSIVIPSRTLQHRRSRGERLTVEESDRVFRVLHAFSHATDLYGSQERALQWLRRPHPRLEGRTPLSLLRTDTGSRIVEETLGQIEHGMIT